MLYYLTAEVLPETYKADHKIDSSEVMEVTWDQASIMNDTPIHNLCIPRGDVFLHLGKATIDPQTLDIVQFQLKEPVLCQRTFVYFPSSLNYDID